MNQIERWQAKLDRNGVVRFPYNGWLRPVVFAAGAVLAALGIGLLAAQRVPDHKVYASVAFAVAAMCCYVVVWTMGRGAMCLTVRREGFRWEDMDVRWADVVRIDVCDDARSARVRVELTATARERLIAGLTDSSTRPASRTVVAESRMYLPDQNGFPARPMAAWLDRLAGPRR